MKRILVRCFGLITAVIMNIFIYVIYGLTSFIAFNYQGIIVDPFGYVFGKYIAFLLRFAFLIFMILIMFSYISNMKWKLKSLLGYYILFIFIFEKTFINFVWDIIEFPFNYNPNIGIAWIIALPINFLAFVIMGLVFDNIKNKKIKW